MRPSPTKKAPPTREGEGIPRSCCLLAGVTLKEIHWVDGYDVTVDRIFLAHAYLLAVALLIAIAANGAARLPTTARLIVNHAGLDAPIAEKATARLVTMIETPA